MPGADAAFWELVAVRFQDDHRPVLPMELGLPSRFNGVLCFYYEFISCFKKKFTDYLRIIHFFAFDF